MYKNIYNTQAYYWFTELSNNIEHGAEHVKKVFSTAVIVNEDTHSTFVRGH